MAKLATVKSNEKTAKPVKPAKTIAATASTSTSQPIKKLIVGTVSSDKMDKTIVVRVVRRVKNPLYKKYVTTLKKFKVHDENNEAKTGDLVQIIECKPMSREKRFSLKTILRKGPGDLGALAEGV